MGSDLDLRLMLEAAEAADGTPQSQWTHTERRAYFRFMSEASPAIVLALLARAQAAEADATRLRTVLDRTDAQWEMQRNNLDMLIRMSPDTEENFIALVKQTREVYRLGLTDAVTYVREHRRRAALAREEPRDA